MESEGTSSASNSDRDGGPITFEDLGIKRAPSLTDSPLGGKRRKLEDFQKKEFAFIGITALSLLAVFVLTIIKLVDLAKANNIRDPDFTFALILLANTVFCIYYLIHSVFTERPYEILVLVAATFIVWIYIIVNFALGPKRDDVKLVRLVFASVLSPCICILGLLIAKNYYDSGRLIFRTVGANSTLQDMCKTLYAFLGLLKFDLQLGVTMVLLILTTGMKVDTGDIVILSVGIPVTIICFTLGYLCVRLENKILALFYIPSLVLAPAYFIYKIYDSAEYLTTANQGIMGTTFVCALLAMITRIMLCVFFYKTFRNFGNGLKEKVYAVSPEETGRTAANPSTTPDTSTIQA